MGQHGSGGPQPLATFLVERYWPGVSPEQLEEAVARGTRSVRAMRRRGRPIRYLRSTLIPDDETVLCLFEAASSADVAEVNRGAGMPFDRIVDAVTLVPAMDTA